MAKIKDKYQITQKYIRLGNARSGAKLTGGKPSFAVAHETANNTADAMAHFRHFDSNQPDASAHTFIDDKLILEIIPLDEKAWHVMYNKPLDNELFGDDANDDAIGVELCRTGVFADAYDRFVWYFAYLCKKFGMDPKKKIVSHKTLDPQRRTDPDSWLNPHGITYAEFIADVVEYFNNWDEDPAGFTGWKQAGDGKWSYLVKGEKKTGWIKLSGKWYFLDNKGVMLTGWQKIKEKWYFLEGNGAMFTGWLKWKDVWYYLDRNAGENEGVMVTGLWRIDGETYYFDEKGRMLTGKVNLTLNFAANGKLITNK